MTSTPALALQAAVAVASAVFFARTGAVFYLFDEFHRTPSLGAGHLVTWVALAAVSCAAALAALLGRRWIAAGASLLGTTYLLTVAAVMLYTDAHAEVVVLGGGSYPFSFYSLRYQNLVATPAILGISVLATITSAVAAVRGRHVPSRPFLGWRWLTVATAGLAAAFALAGQGNALLPGGRPILDPFMLPNGGIMDAFEFLWFGALAVALLWMWLDPRFGWAMVLVTTPVLAYEVSILVIATGPHYRVGTSGWWALYGEMFGVLLATAVVGVLAGYLGVRLRRAEAAPSS